VEVAFKLPVPLPGTVAFSATPTGGPSAGGDVSWGFGLHDAKRGRPYLVGEVTSFSG
jgi:hypothetical protein